MRVINFKGFKNVPRKVLVAYIFSAFLILLAVIMLIVDLIGLCDINKTLIMFTTIDAVLIHNKMILPYKDQLYKEI